MYGLHIHDTSIFIYNYRYKTLSYDVAVFQWITSCHKNRMDNLDTCNNTFAGIRNVIDDVRNNNVNFH